MSDLNVVDKFALYAGGALVVFGIVGVGLLEMIAGAPHPVTGEGQIVHEALVPIAIRSYVILVGFLLWGGLAVWRFATSSAVSGYGVPTPTETE
jgi:hypothetical protein